MAPPNAYPASGTVASDGYLDASQEDGYYLNTNYHTGREVHDTLGAERKDTWTSKDQLEMIDQLRERQARSWPSRKVFDADGNCVAWSDQEVGEGKARSVAFTPPVQGSYRVEVGAFLPIGCHVLATDRLSASLAGRRRRCH